MCFDRRQIRGTGPFPISEIVSVDDLLLFYKSCLSLLSCFYLFPRLSFSFFRLMSVTRVGRKHIVGVVIFHFWKQIV